MPTATLLALAPRTGSGAGGTVASGGANSSLRLQLAVTDASGTLPTLQVFVEDSIDSGVNWNVIATFNSMALVGPSQAINVTGPIGTSLRVRWVIGGRTPSFTFAVTAYYTGVAL